MSIEVRVPTILRKHTGGERCVSGSGSTLRELVTNLDGQYSGIGAALVGDDGKVHRFINVYLNDEDVRFLGGIETPLNDGDQISILPAVAGGAV